MFIVKEKELISVVITTYNRVELLKKSLNSVINQTYKNIEIIVADNHSTDGTDKLLEEYTKQDNRIKYFRHSENIGMTNNTTFAHSKITGKYFHVLCDDDWLDKDFIEKSYEEFKKHPDYSFIAPTAWLYDISGDIILKGPTVMLDDNSIGNRIQNYIIANRNNSVITNGLLKTSLLKSMLKEDGFALKCRFGEDWVFVAKFLIAGKCKMINSTHYHKLHDGATSRIKTMSELWDITGINAKNMYYKIAETINDSISNDNFCKNRLNVKQRRECAQKVAEGINTIISQNHLKYFLLSPSTYFGKIGKVINFVTKYLIIGY